MPEYTDGVPNAPVGPPQYAEDTELAQGEYAAFFERNRAGITHVDYGTRTYYVMRTWVLRGPIPKGTKVAHMGLANGRRASKVKRRRR
jgi:hypothetical protein